MQTEDAYLKLLKALLKTAEAAKGTPAGEDDRILDAEGLMVKFYYHCITAFYLSRSTTVREIAASFYDFPSINVICRAAIETFLTFHYVFVEPKNTDEKDFRYWTWLMGGLIKRQNYKVRLLEGIKQLEREKVIIEQLAEKVNLNVCFTVLAEGKKKKKILTDGLWRLKSWTEIALSAGLSAKHARQFYSHLREYAHSGSVSITQIYQASPAEVQRVLIKSTLEVLMITMAFMIKAYASVFPQTASALDKEKDLSDIVELWREIGSGDIQDI